MMTVTEYEAHVRNKKSEMLELTDKTANSQKDIALITIGEHYGKFIEKTREIFQEFGFKVHWYHYTNEITKELNMGIEIADLRPHYHKVFVFDDEMDWRFADAAYEVASRHVPTNGVSTLCIFGNDDRVAVRFVGTQMLRNKRIIAKPHGVGNTYSDVFESDIVFIFDRRSRLNCYPIYKPVFYVFPWQVINEEERQTYDMGEEIVLEVINNYVCG